MLTIQQPRARKLPPAIFPVADGPEQKKKDLSRTYIQRPYEYKCEKEKEKNKNREVRVKVSIRRPRNSTYPMVTRPLKKKDTLRNDSNGSTAQLSNVLLHLTDAVI